MSNNSALNRVKAPNLAQHFGLGKDSFARLKSVTVASAISMLLIFLAFLQPLDQLSWVFQSRIASHQPSGDIVFVGSDRDLADPRLPARPVGKPGQNLICAPTCTPVASR